MTKTFKLGAIFFICVLWMVLIRIAVGFMNLSDNVLSWLFSFLVQCIGMGLIPFVLYKQWIKGSVKEDFHLQTKINPLYYLIAVLLGFLLYYVTMGVSLIYQNLLILLGFKHVTTSVGVVYSGWEVLAMEFITVAILPAFFEEFVDRGLLMSVFRNEEDERKKLILMAVIFALAHQNITQTGYTIVGGLVLAFMALKTKSIWPGVIIHFINNGINVILDYSSQKQNFVGKIYDEFQTFLSNNIFLIMATWIATGFIIVYLLKIADKISKKEKKEEVQLQNEIDLTERIYKLFGMDSQSSKQTPALQGKTRAWEYGMVLASAALCFLTTLFTFIWGLLR